MANGGYRLGSGRSKSGYYKGIYCGSTYELCWLIHALDTNVNFTRFDGMLTDGVVKYIPDFFLPESNTIVELKGYEAQKSVDVKTKLANSLGYKVVVLRKNDLAHIFKYVSDTYHTTKFYTLYDGYKPKYSYQCTDCGEEFTKDSRLKTTKVYCSRVCAGRGNKQYKILSKQKILDRAKRFYENHKDRINKQRREKKNTPRSSSG